MFNIVLPCIMNQGQLQTHQGIDCPNAVVGCCRSACGMELMCCSVDGTVAYLGFSQDELGTPASHEDKVTCHSYMHYIMHQIVNRENLIKFLCKSYMVT